MSAFAAAAAAVDIHSQTCLINANAAPIAQLPSPSLLLSLSLSDNCNESASDNINGHINKEERRARRGKKTAAGSQK